MHAISRVARGILPFAVLFALVACDGNPVGEETEPPPVELPAPTIVLSAPTRTVAAGGTLPVSAAVTEANGSVSTRPVQWQSSNHGVATVNASGVVSGVAAGTATITASVGGASSTFDLTVMRAPNLGGPLSTFLSYDSRLGDFIGQGSTARYGVTNGTWSATLIEGGKGVRVRYGAGGATWWTAEFEVPQGQTLRVGTYENATRYPFQAPNVPGLSFFGNGRGCNTLTGRFAIHDIAIDHEGALHRFHATFRQHCEGGAAYLDGEVAILQHPLR